MSRLSEVRCAMRGSLLEPKFPWNFVRTDACQYGMESPALDDGMAVEKGQIWLGNYCLSGRSFVCRIV